MSTGGPMDNEASARAHMSSDAPSPSPSTGSAITTTTLALLKSLLALSPDAAVVIDQAGTIVQLNSQAGLLFGYTPDQLIGRPLEALLPERLRSSHLAHRGYYLETPHSRPMGVGLDLIGRRQDGSEFPVDISLRPYLIKRQLHVMAAIRDVSVQRQWERERKDLIKRLRLQTDLINLAHDAILVRGPVDRILVWNTGAEDLYGWRTSEAIGQVTHTLFKTDSPRAASSSRPNSTVRARGKGNWFIPGLMDGW